MRITGIADIVVPISSSIRNAYIDFSQMTASVVAIFTDIVRDGKPVVGFGFNSNGRYAPQGLLRERFIPRLKGAKPEEVVDARGIEERRTPLDPVHLVPLCEQEPGKVGAVLPGNSSDQRFFQNVRLLRCSARQTILPPRPIPAGCAGGQGCSRFTTMLLDSRALQDKARQSPGDRGCRGPACEGATSARPAPEDQAQTDRGPAAFPDVPQHTRVRHGQDGDAAPRLRPEARLRRAVRRRPPPE